MAVEDLRKYWIGPERTNNTRGKRLSRITAKGIAEVRHCLLALRNCNLCISPIVPDTKWSRSLVLLEKRLRIPPTAGGCQSLIDTPWMAVLRTLPCHLQAAHLPCACPLATPATESGTGRKNTALANLSSVDLLAVPILDGMMELAPSSCYSCPSATRGQRLWISLATTGQGCWTLSRARRVVGPQGTWCGSMNHGSHSRIGDRQA